jgi:uncharacterized protein YjlB
MNCKVSSLQSDEVPNSAVFLLIVRYKKILEGTGRQRLKQELASNNSSGILWNSIERTVTLREQ